MAHHDNELVDVIDGDISEFLEFDYATGLTPTTTTHQDMFMDDVVAPPASTSADNSSGLTTITLPLQTTPDGKQVFILMPSNYTIAVPRTQADEQHQQYDDAQQPQPPTMFVQQHQQRRHAVPVHPKARLPQVPIPRRPKAYAKDERTDCAEIEGGDIEVRIATPDLPEPKIFKPKKQKPSITYRCQLCDYISTKRFMLQRHMKSHSEVRPHVCTQCNKGFKTASALRNHEDIHDGIKRFPCRRCEMAFVTSGEMHRHVRYKHSFEKPHACPLCSFATVETSKLKRHLRMHTGERPYKCDECEYAAADTARLRRHQRVHSGERPYECDVCFAKFAQGNTLKAHMCVRTASCALYARYRATHAPKETRQLFECPHCSRQLTRATDLKAHIKSLHEKGDEPIPCSICSETFVDRFTMRAHRVNEHKPHGSKAELIACDVCDFVAKGKSAMTKHRQVHASASSTSKRKLKSGVESSDSEHDAEEDDELEDGQSLASTRPRRKTSSTNSNERHETMDAARALAHLSHQSRRRFGGDAFQSDHLPKQEAPNLEQDLQTSFGFAVGNALDVGETSMTIVHIQPVIADE